MEYCNHNELREKQDITIQVNGNTKSYQREIRYCNKCYSVLLDRTITNDKYLKSEFI